MERKAQIEEALKEVARSFDRLVEYSPVIDEAGQLLVDAVCSGGKVMFCGNGGSAADAQHLAAELMGRFLRDRAPLAALSLTVDTSAITAIGNDFGYEYVFSRQLAGIGRKGDALVGISTSGNSKNVIGALETARRMGIRTIGLTGGNGGAMAEHCDVCIRVPASRTDQIQQMHIAIGHILCGLVEDAACG